MWSATGLEPSPSTGSLLLVHQSSVTISRLGLLAVYTPTLERRGADGSRRPTGVCLSGSEERLI